MRRCRLWTFAVAGDQPLAQQDLHPLLCAFFDEALRLHDKNLADELRLVHQHNIARPHAIMRHLPVRRRQVFEEQDRIADTKEPPRKIQGKVELQSWREAIAATFFNNPVGSSAITNFFGRVSMGHIAQMRQQVHSEP